MKTPQKDKAEAFLALHHDKRLLVLPNVWDVLGAKLIERSGLPAMATASASVAFSRGYQDGQHIPFNTLLQVLQAICQATDLPVSADMERGYANDNAELADNTKQLIEAGVIGINIEDSIIEGGELTSLDQQCERIQCIRKAADEEGIPLVINARCDIYLKEQPSTDPLSVAIKRGQMYKEAGADCYYPILCPPHSLHTVNAEVDLPLNVLAVAGLMPMKELEEMGIARISLGPGLLKAALTSMRTVIQSVMNYEDYQTFANPDIITSQEIVDMIS
ncbi:MAG: isocitrate lyase/phosphoenolpyruvate mutase family protein [Bacteroidota bacterium]